jgi:hypothetical protein
VEEWGGVATARPDIPTKVVLGAFDPDGLRPPGVTSRLTGYAHRDRQEVGLESQLLSETKAAEL